VRVKNGFFGQQNRFVRFSLFEKTHTRSKLVISSTHSLSILRAVFYIRYTRGPLILTDAVAEEGSSVLGRYIYKYTQLTHGAPLIVIEHARNRYKSNTVDDDDDDEEDGGRPPRQLCRRC